MLSWRDSWNRSHIEKRDEKLESVSSLTIEWWIPCILCMGYSFIWKWQLLLKRPLKRNKELSLDAWTNPFYPAPLNDRYDRTWLTHLLRNSVNQEILSQRIFNTSLLSYLLWHCLMRFFFAMGNPGQSSSKSSQCQSRWYPNNSALFLDHTKSIRFRVVYAGTLLNSYRLVSYYFSYWGLHLPWKHP